VTLVRDFRFSYNVFGLGSRAEFLDVCRGGERAGYDTVFATDHLGNPAPFPALVAAAAATERLRVGTLVLNAPFWNPSLLAREIATTDVLTDGRLEVGLGAGHMKWEFDEAGIAWEPFGARVDGMRALIERLRAEFAADGYPQQQPLREQFGIPALRPVQRTGFGGHGPPLIVGGTGERVLRVAGEYADIVGVAGALQLKGSPPGTMRIATDTEIDGRVRFARECAGDRDVEWHILVQAVVPADDREAAASGLAERFGGVMSAAEILASPFVLLGTVAEMADQVQRNRERWGFSYYTVHGPFREAFAPVIERLRP
jgi:probable F420-dependent oxidoreductase